MSYNIKDVRQVVQELFGLLAVAFQFFGSPMLAKLVANTQTKLVSPWGLQKSAMRQHEQRLRLALDASTLLILMEC